MAYSQWKGSSMRYGAAAVVVAGMMMCLIGVAAGQLVIPDEPKPVEASQAVQKPVREMMAGYQAAVTAEDIEKAMSFCASKNERQTKVVKISIAVDMAIVKLHERVEKKLGKDAWGTLGERLAEVSEASDKAARITELDGDDLVQVQWYADSKIPEEKRFAAQCPIRKTKDGWRFDIFVNGDDIAEMRRGYRDVLAEVTEIQADVEAGRITSADELTKRVEMLVKDARGGGAEEETTQPDSQPAATAPVEGM